MPNYVCTHLVLFVSSDVTVLTSGEAEPCILAASSREQAVRHIDQRRRDLPHHPGRQVRR